MTLETTGRPARAESERRLRVRQSRAPGNVARRMKLPEHLEQAYTDALIRHAPMWIASF